MHSGTTRHASIPTRVPRSIGKTQHRSRQIPIQSRRRISTSRKSSIPQRHTKSPVSISTISHPQTNPLVFSSLRRRLFSSSPNVSGAAGDIIPFPLADIGEGIFEVEVLQWFVNQGDTVAQFQKICEVQSDKANVEITSRYDGVIDTLSYKVGEMAKVGAPLLTIKLAQSLPGSADSSASTPATPQASAPVCAVAAAAAAAAVAAVTPHAGVHTIHPPRPESEILASPSVRHRARGLSVNLGAVRATGIRGQITNSDLDNFLAEQAAAQGVSAADDASRIATIAAVAANTMSEIVNHNNNHQQDTIPIPTRQVSSGTAHQDVVLPVTGIQKVMVKTMTAAASIPTLGFSDEICVDNLITLRKQLVPKAKQHGVSLSPFAFIVKALSLALDKYPQMNSTVNTDCSQITQKGAHNIGLAMDTPKGLLVPNIKNVQDKSILEIAGELNRLQALGAAGKLGQYDLSDGTITLSNIGSIGGTYCQPILVVPQVAIAALGKFYTKAAFTDDGKVYPSTVMNIGWTADHRALDGATVARFNNELKNLIENPQEMLLY